MQPVDRKNTKHHSKVDKRAVPQLVRRSNKCVLLSLSSVVVATQIDSSIRGIGMYNDYYSLNYFKMSRVSK